MSKTKDKSALESSALIIATIGAGVATLLLANIFNLDDDVAF
ncbi:MAG: hypothetical protein V7459_07075 [Oceanicoccus sp.]